MDLPEGFEEVVPEGFEVVASPKVPATGKVAAESPGLLDFLMGAPRKGKEQSSLGKAARTAAGVGEAGLNLGTSMIGQAMIIPGLINNARYGKSSGNTDKDAGEIMHSYTYEPRTETGQNISEHIGQFMNDVGIPLAGVAHTLPPVTRRPALPKVELTKAVPEGFEVVAEAPDAGVPKTPIEGTWMENQMRQGEARDAAEQQFADQRNIQGELDMRPRQMPVDENGMPVDMARSLDAQEATAPRQVDLFNEEVRATSEMERAKQFEEQQAREAAIEVPKPDEAAKQAQIEQAYADRQKQLFDDSVEIRKASREDELSKIQQDLIEGNPIPRARLSIPKSQRGAIDVQGINEGFKKLEDGITSLRGYLDSWQGAFHPLELDAMRKSLENPASKDTIVFLSPEQFHDLAEKRVSDFGSSTARRESVREGLKSLNGLSDIPYLKGTIENGEFKVDAHNGRHRMDVFQEKGIQAVPVRLRVWNTPEFTGWGASEVPHAILGENGKAVPMPENMSTKGQGTFTPEPTFNLSLVPKSQRGAIDLGVPEPKPDNKISKLTQDSPEIVAAKKQLQKETKQGIAAQILNDPAFDAYTTRIDSPEKVIALAPDAKDLGPTQAFKAKTVSPGINSVAISSNNPLVRYARDAISKTVRSADQITKQFVTGKEGFGTKLERLSQEEKNQVVATLQEADRKQQAASLEGLNAKQQDLVKHIQTMDAFKLDLWNNVRNELGLPTVKNRQGHFAGNFAGDYRTVVLDKDGNAIGVIGTNTKWGNEQVKKQVVAKDSSVKFMETKRQSLGGSGQKLAAYEGLQDVMAVLAKNDPRLAKIQEIVDAAIKDRGDSLYGASLHAKQKKGVWGNEGNQFWKDRNENTNAALKSFVNYWEEGIASHLNLPTEVKLKELMDNPVLDHMPRAKEYVNDYINNFTGRNLGTVGDAINKIIDSPARWTGLGPTVTRNAITQFNKRASQFTMGFVNPLFLITQYLQVPQMGLPELVKIQSSLGLDPTAAGMSMTRAVSDGLKIAHEEISGKPADVTPLVRDAYKYAKDNGLLSFSEYANARDIFQNKGSKAFDKVADYAREQAEKQTRPLMFFAAVDMLKDSGLSPKEVFDTAYNITQHAMVNYHQSEKPLMYGKMGVMGQAAGSLQTFKHAFLGQFGTLIKDASKGKPGGLITAGAAMLAYSGLKGVPFYQEADELFKLIGDKFFNQRKSIADTALKESPEWLKSGVLSTATGVNMQSRLSAADVLPNSPAEAISPFTSWGVKIGQGVGDVMSNNDPLAWSNLASSVAPSGTIKGLVDTTLKSNAKGESLNKMGQVDYSRNPMDTAIKRYTGGTSLKESLDKEKTYNDLLNQKSRQEGQKKVVLKAERLLAQGILTEDTMKELTREYRDQKGDPEQLVQSLIDFAKSRNQTTKQRLEGIPDGGLGGVYKYQNYNN